MDIVYCKSFPKEPKFIFNENEARQRHNTRKNYMAFIKKNDQLFHLLIFFHDTICVHLRGIEGDHYKWYHSCEYSIIDNQLFLSNAIFYVYDTNVLNRIKTSLIYIFKQDGTLSIVTKDQRTENLTRDLEKTIDVGENWTSYPEFGQYNALYERNISEYIKCFDEDMSQYL